MDYEVEWHIKNTTPEQNIAHLLETGKKILHVGGDISLSTLLSNTEYHRLEISEISKIEDIDSDFDYIIFSDVLELIDDPQSLINLSKNKTKETVIYEFKYDENCIVDPSWKQSWKTVGLEYFLSKEFDYVSSIFLGYATVHICSTPYNQNDTEREILNAIR